MIESLKAEGYEVIKVTRKNLKKLKGLQDDAIKRGVKFGIVVKKEDLIDLGDKLVKILDGLNTDIMMLGMYWGQSARSETEGLYCVRYYLK